ncbi:MAG: TetR/AcrR family transcriptional regulator [Promethearchaeota archaeon]
MSEQPKSKLTWAERRERIKKSKRNLFLMVSLQVFEEKGYNHTRIIDIAERAGTSVGSFYFYFNNKEELLEEILWKYSDLFMKRLKRETNKKNPPISDLRRLFLDYAIIFKERKNLGLIFLEQLGGINKKFASMKTKLINDWCKEFEDIIIKLRNNEISKGLETELYSRMWVGALLELVHWWMLSNFNHDVETLADIATNIGLNGIYGLKN